MTYRLEITSAAADGGAATGAPHSLGLTCKTTTAHATAQSLPVSVLDLVPTRSGEPGGRAIARPVGLALHVEQLGYKRAQKFLPSSVTSGPLPAEAPTVDLVFGYRKSSQSSILESSTSAQALIIEWLNLLGDPFIQNGMHVRAVDDVYPKRGVLMDV